MGPGIRNHTWHFSVHKPSPKLMVKNCNLADNFITSTTAQIYPFCSYTDPMALMIVNAHFCQVPGQVQLENMYQRQTRSHISKGLLTHGTSLIGNRYLKQLRIWGHIKFKISGFKGFIYPFSYFYMPLLL